MVKKMLNTENTMSNTTLTQLQEGLATAYIDGTAAANLAYKPAFVSNSPEEGKKVSKRQILRLPLNLTPLL